MMKKEYCNVGMLCVAIGQKNVITLYALLFDCTKVCATATHKNPLVQNFGRPAVNVAIGIKFGVTLNAFDSCLQLYSLS